MADLEAAAKVFAERDLAELGDAQLMAACIEAARADATNGEMMGVLKAGLGWGAPP